VITVIIAVRNEALNLKRCLSAVSSMDRVVVVDSNSTDDTAAIAHQMGAEVIQFEYGGGYPKKRQWALDQLDITTPWVLLLDADEVVPESLLGEIEQVLSSSPGNDGYLINKGFHFLGKRFRFGGFSHEALLLFRTGAASFERLDDIGETGLDMEVHERLIVDGKIGRLQTPLIHDDHKGLFAYLARHNSYSTWEAAVRFSFINSGQWGKSAITARLFGNTQERRRFLKQVACRVPCEPWLWFCYHYFFRLGFLEGMRGLIASRIRAQYISNVRAKLYELRLADDEEK
jgi:glycosyltransferase involved in cell wall biosynthesis